MLLGELVATSARVGASSRRLEKIGLLSELLRRAEADEIEIAVAFLAGRLRQGRIGIGGAALQSAAGGASREPVLTLSEVDETMSRFLALSGRGSVSARSSLLSSLFSRATREESDFLARLLVGEVRQGALGGLMEEAVARASGIPVAEIRRAHFFAGSLETVARAALTEGRAGLSGFRADLFRPLAPMLAQPGGDLDESLRSLGEAALEYKLDGARIQIHRLGDDVRVYSRRLHDVTPAVPEIVEVARALPAREMILDGEAIALRPDGTPHPFQVTMSRFGRRLDVARSRETLPLRAFLFDAIRLDGQDLHDLPARERFRALRSVAEGLAVPQRVTSDPAEAEAFFDEALRAGHEGVMMKGLDSRYEAGRRGGGWLKMKPAHTLDLVVLAAEWGHGRRTGWLSNLHLGARDPGSGSYVMLGKTFKGMTDEMLEWQTRRFREIETDTDGTTVHVRPEVVVEVAFNDVQASPQYPAGIALRFARVKRYRPDKTPAEADTLDRVLALAHPGTKRRAGSAERAAAGEAAP
ncbi:MAG TPA: ATP-dependent DNA ligase [Candidatus Eisenbacteria bacterium]|nr:ATP-dependent DNA ligase [Candidatus Eisenbacteria bacterium]